MSESYPGGLLTGLGHPGMDPFLDGWLLAETRTLGPAMLPDRDGSAGTAFLPADFVFLEGCFGPLGGGQPIA